MTVKDLVKSVKACLTSQYKCQDCVFCNCDQNMRCQILLAQAVEKKFGELVNLLDDKANHHYYDTLEFYQEENAELRWQLEAIEAVLRGNVGGKGFDCQD